MSSQTVLVDRLGRTKWEFYPCGGYLHVSYVVEAPPYGFPEELGFDPVTLDQVEDTRTPQERGADLRQRKRMS